MWTSPGGEGEGRELNYRSALLRKPAIGGGGMRSVIYWMGGESEMTHFRPRFGDCVRPIAPPPSSPDPPVLIIMRIAKRIADWICNPM